MRSIWQTRCMCDSYLIPQGINNCLEKVSFYVKLHYFFYDVTCIISCITHVTKRVPKTFNDYRQMYSVVTLMTITIACRDNRWKKKMYLSLKSNLEYKFASMFASFLFYDFNYWLFICKACWWLWGFILFYLFIVEWI